MRFLILLALLAGLVSCKSEDRVTEGDREVVKQTEGAAKVIVEAVDKVEAVPGVPVAALEALSPVRPAAKDIVKNSETLLKNFGQPKESKPYSTEASAEAQKQTVEEHETGSIWPFVVTGAGMAAGVFLRSAGLGGIPVLGKLIARVAPRFAQGAGTADDMNLGYQEVLTGARSEIDKWGGTLRDAMIKKGLPASLIAMIPTGEIVVDKVTKIMARRGLLVENDQLLQKARRDAKGTSDVTVVSAPPQSSLARIPDTEGPDKPTAAS